MSFTIDKTIPYLNGERLILKPISMEHCTDRYVSWMNDPEVYKYLETGGDYTKEMLADYIQALTSRYTFFWGIHTKEGDQHIGNIKIDPINNQHGYGEYGILMGDRNEWGKGYAKEASLSVINYCFENLGLRKIILGVVAQNLSAVAMYKKIGFIVEGIYRQHGFYNGLYHDVLRMAIFNPSLKS
jgi:ribosomal-protein-alanine N-acetyltransferase